MTYQLVLYNFEYVVQNLPLSNHLELAKKGEINVILKN
jgi:hypothetical protein